MLINGCELRSNFIFSDGEMRYCAEMIWHAQLSFKFWKWLDPLLKIFNLIEFGLEGSVLDGLDAWPACHK